MEWYWIVALIGVGIGAGLLSGLLGISGGVVTVPSLLLIFREMGLPSDYLMHVAVGTSLSSMAFNSFSSMMTHHKRKAVVWDAVVKMLVGLFLGAIIGAMIAGQLPSFFLQIFFGVFEILIGLNFLRPLKIKDGSHPLPSFAMLAFASFVISGLSTILGIGGGLMITPLLLWLGFEMRKSIGTASAGSFFVCTVGAISYLFVGLTSGVKIPDCLGFIHFPAFLTIVLTAPFAAVGGAFLTHRLPVGILRKVFGVALIVAGAAVIW